MRSNILYRLLWFAVVSGLAMACSQTDTVSKQVDDETGLDHNIIGASPENAPIFPGGEAEMIRFIASNVGELQRSGDTVITGIVWTSITISKEGKVRDAKVLRGVNGAPIYNKEALRIIALMPDWTPGKLDGVPVDMRYRLPIKFVKP